MVTTSKTKIGLSVCCVCCVFECFGRCVSSSFVNFLFSVCVCVCVYCRSMVVVRDHELALELEKKIQKP